MTCAHCYVSGGRDLPIAYDNFRAAIKRLRIIINGLDGEKYVTLGNEVFTHPKATQILTTVHEVLPEYSSYKAMGGGIPTTGIALLNRHDKNEVLRILKKMDCSGFDFSVLGGRTNHNALVKNSRAFDALVKFAQWTAEQNIALGINLIISKPLIDDCYEISAFVKQFPNAAVSPVIPIYLPVDRLRTFEQYRAEQSDYLKLKDKLSELGINKKQLLKTAHDHSEKSIFEALEKNSFDYRENETKQPLWTFFNITREYELYYGNAGAHTQKLGNILTDPPHKLLSLIQKLPSNYGWSAYYDINKLPPIDKLLLKISPLTTNYVYPSIQDCIYRWLDKCGSHNYII